MNNDRKSAKYERIFKQLEGLLTKTEDKMAKMATVAAVLHGKMKQYFWTGFYRVIDGELTVGPYQGPVACQILAKNKGVCWASVNQKQSVVVEDVEAFPDHIACDSRSKSEIVIPLFDADKNVIAVLDVDSDKLATFDEIDRQYLEKIVKLI